MLLIALGTNDILVARPPWQVRDDILALKTRAEQARPGLRVLVALVPPHFLAKRDLEGNLGMTNALLRTALPATQLLDFFTGMGREDVGPDGVHVSPAGQAKRAEVACRALGCE